MAKQIHVPKTRRITWRDTHPELLIVDLFCGAGGTTTGFAQVTGAQVIACVNHDPLAIKSHWLNHPEVVHFEEDIRTLNLSPLISLVKLYRKMYPNAKLILWASLECTNFSKAKGGQPRDADSRTLADHLHRYILALNPDYIQIENVVEFKSWGPLDENGKPLSRNAGEDWVRWCKEIDAHGYRNEWKEMNSADYGAYTSRNRLFGVFARPNMPIVWPAPTHTKKPHIDPSLLKWKPVKEVLDFADQGNSIFNRKKPLSDNTLERIYAGLIKYVAKGDASFISKYYSGKPAGKNVSVDGPAGTVTCVNGQALVQTEFLLKYNSKSKKGKHIPPSVDAPCPTIATQVRLGLVRPEFLTHYYGSGGQHSSIENPAPVIPTRARTAMIKPEFFIDKQFTGYRNNQSIEVPAGTIMTNDKHSLVRAEPFIMRTSYSNQPTSIDEPAPTILASRKHHYLLNPSHGGHTVDIDRPCPVIIARQDKAPLYFIEAEEGSFKIAVNEGDSEVMIRIKQFMAAFGLVDIKMRMLKVCELLRIQGFPPGYRLEGNQADRKKFIGNSVVPHVVRCWGEAMCISIRSQSKAVA